MKNNSKYSLSLSYIDMLYALLLCITVITILTLILVNKKPEPSSKKIDSKAEVLVVMTWDDQSADDIDLWALTPENEKIGYNSMGNTYMSLERDDLGLSNDTMMTNKGKVPIYVNREVITLRAKHAGSYTFNAFFFKRKFNFDANPTVDMSIRPPVAIKIQLIELNPAYRLVTESNIELADNGSEKTAFSCEITEDGKIGKLNFDNRPFILIDEQINGYGYSAGFDPNYDYDPHQEGRF